MKFAKVNMSKRKQAEKLIYDVMDALDKTGTNTEKYKKLFAKMSNTEFESMMKSMWEDDTMNFVLDIDEFDRVVRLEDAERAAKVLGIPLEEYVMLPHLNKDKDNPVVSKVKYIVGYIIFKRLQQTTQKKNSASTHIGQRSAVTGQVTGDDKNGRSSDVENTGLIVYGALDTAREFNGFRADGIQRANYAYSQIATNGSVSLEDIEKTAGIGDRTMLNTIDVMYLGMGIKTDLVDESLVLTKTAKEI